MTKPTIIVIKDAIRRGQQTWTREVTANINGRKVRAHISRDSYDEQSRIYIDVFYPAGLTWNRLETRSGNEAAHLPKIYGMKDDQQIITDSQPIIDDLIDYAIKIL